MDFIFIRDNLFFDIFKKQRGIADNGNASYCLRGFLFDYFRAVCLWCIDILRCSDSLFRAAHGKRKEAEVLPVCDFARYCCILFYTGHFAFRRGCLRTIAYLKRHRGLDTQQIYFNRNDFIFTVRRLRRFV